VRSLLALAIALSACGPKTIWTGRTADRLHRVDVMRDGGLDFVMIDGKRRAAYRGVAGWSIALARDHIAFAAKVGARWLVVHDGRMSRETWDGIGALRLTDDDRLVYIAHRAGGWHVVAGDRVGPRVDAILDTTLTLAGTHVAYVAQLGSHTHAVVDGKLGPAFDGIGQLSLDADGRYAYAARRGLDAFVVTAAGTGARCDGVAMLTLGPRGHVAYVATLGDDQHVAVDGNLGPTIDAVSHLIFRDDGEHVAWIGRLGDSDILVLDDKPLGTWPHRRAAKLAFRPTVANRAGSGLAYVAPTDHGEQVVVDGTLGPIYDEIRTPIWSKDGRLAYAARRGAQWLIVADDRELPAGDSVGDPVFAGHRLAFAGQRGNRGFVTVDDQTFTYDFVFEDTVAFSADGRRWGAVAGDRAREQLFIVIDGAREVLVTVRELYSAVASGGDDSTLRRWTQAELERPATPGSRR
jgi:hypothetical protein